MTRKRVKPRVSYGLDAKWARNLHRDELERILDRGWRGTVFMKRPNGTIIAEHNASIGPWRPIFFFFPKKGCVTLASPARFAGQSDPEALCAIRWSDLRRSMSAADLELVRLLTNALYEQAYVINHAIHLLSRDIDARQSRKETSKHSAAKRASPKTEKVKQEIERMHREGRDPQRRVARIAKAAKCSTTLVYTVLSGKK